MKDYYAILGIPPTATAAEIKKAYRKLAVRYHPDKNPAPDAKEDFQRINEAYDILGDASKRAAYDFQRSNPVFVPQRPVHRDPAYRRPRRKAPPAGPPASYLLMRRWLPHVLWVSRVGIILSTLFFIDLLLPYREVDDGILELSVVRGAEASYVITTDSGERLRVDRFDLAAFGRGRDIRLDVSRIFGRIMTVSNTSQTYNPWVAYIYTTLVFFPIALFVNSLMALMNRKRVEFCFNLNVTGFVLLIVNLIYI